MLVMAEKAKPIECGAEDRQVLERWSRSRTESRQLVERAHMVLGSRAYRVRRLAAPSDAALARPWVTGFKAGLRQRTSQPPNQIPVPVAETARRQAVRSSQIKSRKVGTRCNSRPHVARHRKALIEWTIPMYRANSHTFITMTVPHQIWTGRPTMPETGCRIRPKQ